MTFVNPIGFALLGLALPVLVLHILRPRRLAVTVSSIFLWRNIERPVSAAQPWQKLRFSALLLAQLLAVALLALVVAKPVRLGAAGLAQNTVFIIDASASMAATDGSPDRIHAAAQRAIALRKQMPANGEASIVVAGERPRVILTSSDDPEAFASALRTIEPTQVHPDFAGAFLLAESLDAAAAEIQYLFFSDGGLTEEETKLLPPNTRYERLGEANTNRAISRLTVETRGSGLHARVSIANTGGPESTQALSIDVDGRQAASQTVRVPKSSTIDVEIDLPLGDLVVARLAGGDLLRSDDEAFAVAGRRPELKVLLVGDQLFWKELLTSIPGITVDAVEVATNGDGYDLVVYNRIDVPPDVAAPFIAVAPPAGVPGVEVTGVVENPTITLLQSSDPLLSDVDITDVAIAQAQQLQTTNELLVAGEGAPLLVRGQANQQRFIYVAFSLRESNLAVQLAFPVLGDRMIDELAGIAQTVASIEVGSAVPVDGLASGQILGPDNSRRDYAPGAPTTFATKRGFWTVTKQDAADRVVAVNVPTGESNITPAATLNSPLAADSRAKVATRQQHSLLKWFIFPLLGLLLIEAWLAWRGLGVSRKQWNIALALRFFVAMLLLGALLAPYLRRSSGRVATVFLLDSSASMGAQGDRAAAKWLQDALAKRPSGDLAAIVAFGANARLDRVLEQSSSFDGRAVVVDETATDIAAAIRLGNAVLPTDAKKRIVLIGDGRATAGDALNEAAALGQANIPVDVHTIDATQSDDAAVSSIDVPSLARVGETVDVNVTVVATSAGTATVLLRRDGVDLQTKTVDLTIGDNLIKFSDNAGSSPGAVLRYQAIVQANGDAQPKNDAAFAAIPVDGPAKVLVVEGTANEATALVSAIEAGGVATETINPSQIPDVQELATYAGIVFVNVDARNVSSDALLAVTSAVRDLGRGLVTIGGERSYGVGGYRESPISELLPVDSEILDPKRRKTVAEVLSIDTSGSMANCHCAGTDQQRVDGGVNKTDISRAAAERTISALTENDQVGVLAWNSAADWVIDLQALPPADVIESGLNSLRPNGSTNLLASLDEAAAALQKSSAELRHIILFTDGFTDVKLIQRVADQAGQIYEEMGITISVLGTGEGAAPSLEDIAVQGHGRYYPGTDLDKVPQIMAEEAVIASRDFINEGEFLPEITSNDRVVESLKSSPALLGYIATTAKPGSSTLLRIGPDRDPLLVSWQAGLGTVTSWTSDASQAWSKNWASWDGYVDFWSRVVKDSFQTGDTAGAVKASVSDGKLILKVEGPTNFADGSTGTAVVAGPDGQRYEVPLERTGGSTFAGELATVRSGTYAVGVNISAGGETVLATSTLASESYPAEYSPARSDTSAMAKISTLAGGRGEIQAAQAFDADGLLAGYRRLALAGPFLLLAALLWPLAVMMSRLSLRGASTAGARDGLRRVRLKVRSSIPSIAGDPQNLPASKAPTGPPTAVVPRPASQQTATVNDLLEQKRRRQAQGPQSDGDA